jgi:integrase
LRRGNSRGCEFTIFDAFDHWLGQIRAKTRRDRRRLRLQGFARCL